MFDQKSHDLYSVIESVVYYNYLDPQEGIEHRYGEDECCCCGQNRDYCLIICEDCNKIWTKASRTNGDALDAMSQRITEWIEQEQYYSFERFLIVCSREIDLIFPERKNRDINKLICCLREIEKQKLREFDGKEIDVLVKNVAQRWNILEEVML